MSSVRGPLFIVAESSPGDAEAIAAGDAVHYIGDATPKTVGATQPREIIDGDSASYADLPPQVIGSTLAYTNEVKAPATLGLAPELGPLWESGGMFEALVPSTSSTYSVAKVPMAAAQPSVTVEYHQVGGDGNEFIMQGSRAGASSFDWTTEQPLRYTTAIQGGYTIPTDTVEIDPTYNAGLPFNRITAFNFGGYDAITRAWNVQIPMETGMGQGKYGTVFGQSLPVVIRKSSAAISGAMTLEQVDQTAFTLWSDYQLGTQAAGTVTFTTGAWVLTYTFSNVRFGPPDPVDGLPNTVTIPYTADSVTWAFT